VLNVATKLIESLISILTDFETYSSQLDKESARLRKLFLLQFVLKYCVVFYAACWLKDLDRITSEVLFQVLIFASIDVLLQTYRTISPKKVDRDNEGDAYDVDAEYMDLVLQFGFVSMWSFGCPWVAILACVKTLLGSQIFALQKLSRCRRPLIQVVFISCSSFLSRLLNAIAIIFSSGSGQSRALAWLS
jgi:Calcium-activated chloride channel